MTQTVLPRSLAEQAEDTTPFAVLELPGRGVTFACDVPGPAPDSPAVVLLHGLLATGALNWSPFVDDLALHFRVVAVDHRGHGRGIVGDESFTLEDCADDVDALLEALGIEQAILAGYSMGGPIAQLVWRRHPQRVRGLVLCATAARFGLTPIGDLLLPVVDRAGRALSLIPSSVRSLITAPALALLVPDAELKAEVGLALAQHDLTSVRAAIRSIARFSSVDWLDGVSVPTAIVVTERDRVVPSARQDELANLIPGAEAFRLDADHLACFDDCDMFGTALIAACESVAIRSMPPKPVNRLRAAWRRWRSRPSS